MIVLLTAIPLAAFYDFAHEHDYTLGHISYHIIPNNLLVQLPDSFLGGMTFPDFSEVFSATSLKYIVMFALVGSLESLLSAKAIDILDPYKRKSDLNKDTLAVGAGNLLAGFIGGLPMISEIVRSSANINNGAKTRWANFFHGVFLLLFVALAADLIEMIPNAALAAMLIYTGYRLASPKEFQKTYQIGIDQLSIFVITVVVTLATDLLLGIFAGILAKFIIHLFSGAPIRSLFSANVGFSNVGDDYVIDVKDAAIFSNYLSFKKHLAKLPPGKNVTFNFAATRLVDHTFMEHLHHFEEEYHNSGGTIHIKGMNKHKTYSDHPLAARKIAKGFNDKMLIKLNARQIMLRNFAEDHDLTFYPITIRNMRKYKDFPIEKGTRILYEENIITAYAENEKIEVTDITVSEGAGLAQHDTKITVAHVSEVDFAIPAFALEPEQLWTRFSEMINGNDIDFEAHPHFSKKYYLRAEDEMQVRNFFTERVLHFLEANESYHIECSKNKLLIYKKREELDASEIQQLIEFATAFVKIAQPASYAVL